MKKRILAMVIAMLLVFSVSAYAVDEGADTEALEIEGSEDVADSPITIVEQIEFADYGTQEVGDLEPYSVLPEKRHDIDTNAVTEQNAQYTLASGNGRSISAVTQSFVDILANEGDIYYMNVTLAPNQIVQATLECPQNESLDYDLLLYDYTQSGDLGVMQTQSAYDTHMNTYADGTVKTLDEGIAFVNKTSIAKTYAVIVIASVGGSATDEFTLTISLDVASSYDNGEPNNSAFQAYAFTGAYLGGANLNVTNDEDWFFWDTDNGSVEAQLNLENAQQEASPYTLEVYTVINGTNKMMLVMPDADGFYSMSGGKYLRVISREGSFASQNYYVNLHLLGTVPAKMVVSLDGDEGPKSYPDYPQGHFFSFEDEIYPKVTVVDSSGLGVRNVPVRMDLESGSWIVESDRRYSHVKEKTGKDGTAVLYLKPATSLGAYFYEIPGGPLPFAHRYDIDTLKITCPENSNIAPFETKVYHFFLSV